MRSTAKLINPWGFAECILATYGQACMHKLNEVVYSSRNYYTTYILRHSRFYLSCLPDLACSFDITYTVVLSNEDFWNQKTLSIIWKKCNNNAIRRPGYYERTVAKNVYMMIHLYRPNIYLFLIFYREHRTTQKIRFLISFAIYLPTNYSKICQM